MQLFLLFANNQPEGKFSPCFDGILLDAGAASLRLHFALGWR
jgi:hypothetical protein